MWDTPGEYNIQFVKGDDYESPTLTFRDGDQTGPVIDFTGWSGSATVRDGYEGTTSRGSFTVTLGGAAGTCVLSMADTATDDLTPNKRYRWDLKLTESGGDVHHALTGTVTVLPRVTV